MNLKLCRENQIKQLTTNVPHHIETGQLICRANQLTGFYMVATLASNELILFPKDRKIKNITSCFLSRYQIMTVQRATG